MTQPQGQLISVMLAVSDTPTAVEWYKHALGATLLWSLGSVAGLEIAGAPFFLGEPANNSWESPSKLGITSTRVEVFCDDPDKMISRAIEAAQPVFLISKITRGLGVRIGKVHFEIRLDTSGSLAIGRH